MTLRKVSKRGEAWVCTDLRDGAVVSFKLYEGKRWRKSIRTLSCIPRGRPKRGNRSFGVPFTVKALCKAQSSSELRGICKRISQKDAHAAIMAKLLKEG